MPLTEMNPASPPRPFSGEKVGEEDGDAVGDEDEEELVLMSGPADDGDVTVSDGRNMEDFLDEDEMAAWGAGGEAATTLEA